MPGGKVRMKWIPFVIFAVMFLCALIEQLRRANREIQRSETARLKRIREIRDNYLSAPFGFMGNGIEESEQERSRRERKG
jgi:hypothetical protein